MVRVFTARLPEGVDPKAVRQELINLVGTGVSVEVRPSTRSGVKGTLGTIDPSMWEIIIQFLDTQAAAAAVEATAAAIVGYLYGKSGQKPTSEERPDQKKDKA